MYEYGRPRRIFDVFLALNRKEVATKKALADKFEVNVETIKADINELRNEFGIDIVYDKSESVYKIVDPGIFETIKVGNPLSAEHVNLILQTLTLTQSFMKSQVDIIKKILIDILPYEEGRKMMESLKYNTNGTRFDDLNNVDSFKRIRKIIAHEKMIEFRYKENDGKFINYRVIPYSLAINEEKLYLIGKEETNPQFINFRIDKMSFIKEGAGGIKKVNFNLSRYMKKSFGMYSGEDTIVTVKFNKECKELVRQKGSVSRLVEEDDNYFIYEFQCYGYIGIKQWLLSLGSKAEVISPKELKDEIKSDLQEMMKVYNL